MADYREKIKIDIETDIDTDKISGAKESFQALSGSLDSLDGTLSGLDVDELNDGLGELQEIGFDGLDVLEDRSNSINETIGHTTDSVRELKTALGEKIDFEARLDTDKFVADLSEDLGEGIDEKDLEVPVAPKGKLETPDVQELEQDISEFMGDVQNMVDENEDLHIQPRVADEATFGTAERANLSNSISRQLKNVHPKITPQLNMEEVADEDLNKLQELSDALELVETKKEEAGDENKRLETRNNNTAKSTDREAKSFSQLIREGDNLTSVKRAAGRANEYLSDVSLEGAKSILREKDSVELNNEQLEVADRILEDLAGSQKNLGSITDATADETDGESRSLKELASSADSAAEMKRNVSKYNKQLGGITKETARDLGIEGDKLEVLTNAGLITSEVIDETSDSTRSLSRTLSAVNESIDDTGDSLRAAAEIGDIFEDGLGSLSVNLGAFTIALRNFLTQIPILITALGSAAEVAAGAASAFIAVAGAIAGAVTAGAIAQAQKLKEEYSQITELGQSIQVIFANVRDTFLEAAEPAFSSESIELFRRTVGGIATSINLFAQAISELMTSSEDDVYSLQKAFDDFGTKVLPQVDRVVEALIFSFEELGEETVSAIATLTGLLADLIIKSTTFVSRIDELGAFLSQFKDTIKALSELGLAVGSGLLPVFSVFSRIMEGLANVLNEVDDEVLGNIITFGALIVAFSKVSGVVSTLVTIIPNLAIGFSTLSQNVRNADNVFRAFQATVAGTLTKLGYFFSQISAFTGVTSLVTALGGMSDRIRQIAFRSASATAKFEALALGTNVTAKQLYDLAVAENLNIKTLKALRDEAEDVKDEYRELQLRLALTDEQFKTLGGDFDVDIDEFLKDLEDPDRLLDTGRGSLIKRLIGSDREVSDAANEAGKAVVNAFDRDGGQFLSQESRNFWKKGVRFKDAGKSVSLLQTAQFDYNRVIGATANKLDNLSTKSMTLTGANNSLTNSILAVKANAMKAAIAFNKYGLSLLATTAKSIKAVIVNGSLSAGLNVLRTSMIGAAISTFIQNSAMLTYIATMLTATGSTYALIAALSKLTLGAFALVAAVGALAVGIITNFDKIKGAGSGVISSLLPIFGALKEILLTVFVETWNVVVAAFSSLKTAISPFIEIIRDFVGIFGILGGSMEDGASSFSMLDTVVSIVVGAIKGLSQAVQILVAAVGIYFKALFTIMTLPLKIIVGLLRQFAKAARFAGTFVKDKFFDPISNHSALEGFIDVLVRAKELFFDLPELIEDFVNIAIRGINKIIKEFNELPFVEIGAVGEVELTGGGLETSREELATDTEAMGEDLARVAPNVINMRTENNQTVNQSIDADPEDKSTVSRVVEDAIERANRFERTRAAQ